MSNKDEGKDYIKKFSIEHISDNSIINMSDHNLRNLMRILDQVSSQKTNMMMNSDKIRQHIQDIGEAKINKKYLMIIKYEDNIVGTGSLLVEDKLIHDMGKVGHIEDVVVDQDYRNLGLAKMLMIKLIECAKDNNCYKVILDASDTVKGFYEKIGFNMHGTHMRLDLLV